MTITPKIKEELHSAAVTFITTFIMVAFPLITEKVSSGSAWEWATVSAIAVAGLRSAVKSVYQYFIAEYSNDRPTDVAGK